jgi:hypothetical protein
MALPRYIVTNPPYNYNVTRRRNQSALSPLQAAARCPFKGFHQARVGLVRTKGLKNGGSPDVVMMAFLLPLGDAFKLHTELRQPQTTGTLCCRRMLIPRSRPEKDMTVLKQVERVGKRPLDRV